MSNTAAIERDTLRSLGSTRPQAHPGGAPDERQHLRLAAAPRKAKLSPLVGALIAVGVILGILATQLGLSIAVSQGAYEARALKVEQRELIRVERVLQQNVDKLASPQNLAVNAAGLGMVQNSHPASLRLSDHAILGDLASPTSAVSDNLVPNSTLDSMPVVDADGLLVPRNERQAEVDDEMTAMAPVPWEGKLPAPETR
ncbi:MAG: hypothetical protein ACTHZ9_04300 [Leucobacter sp.]